MASIKGHFKFYKSIVKEILASGHAKKWTNNILGWLNKKQKKWHWFLHVSITLSIFLRTARKLLMQKNDIKLI